MPDKLRNSRIRLIFICGFILELILAFVPSRGSGRSHLSYLLYHILFDSLTLDVIACVLFVILAIKWPNKWVFWSGSALSLILMAFIWTSSGFFDSSYTRFYNVSIHIAALMQWSGFLYAETQGGSSEDMAQQQRHRILLGLAVIGFMLLMPPWTRDVIDTGYVEGYVTETRHVGYHFILTPPSKNAVINLSRLVVQCGIVAVATAVAVVARGGKRP